MVCGSFINFKNGRKNVTLFAFGCPSYYIQTWAQFGGGHGGCVPLLFMRGVYNMPSLHHFFFSGFVFGEVPKIKVTFATFCVKCFSC